MNADGGAIPWETWAEVRAPDDINALKAQDAGARSKFQTPSSRPDGRANVEVETFDGQALDRARARQSNARMLVLCSGGGGWSDGMRGIGGIEVGGAIDFCDEIMKVYSQNFDHPTWVGDLMDVDSVVNKARQWGKFQVAQMSSPCTDFSKAGKGKETVRSWVTVAGVVAIIRLAIPVLLV